MGRPPRNAIRNHRTPPQGETGPDALEKQASARAFRFGLRETAAEILDKLKGENGRHLFRVNSCGKIVASDAWGVEYRRAKSGAVRERGLTSCGSVWVCPVCSEKISRHRAKELQTAIKRAGRAGLNVAFLTLTVRHGLSDLGEDILHGVSDAIQKMQGRATWKRLKNEWGIVGTVRALETKWNDRNGWHIHAHTLIFYKGRRAETSHEESAPRAASLKAQGAHYLEAAARAAIEEPSKAVATKLEERGRRLVAEGVALENFGLVKRCGEPFKIPGTLETLPAGFVGPPRCLVPMITKTRFDALWKKRERLGKEALRRHIFAEQIAVAWADAAVSVGLKLPNEHGCVLQDGTYAAAYAAKWGLGDELTRSTAKNGRTLKSGEGRTPWQLLADAQIYDDDTGKRTKRAAHAAHLFREYALLFHGRRQLVYSRFLGPYLGLHVVEEDQQILDLELTEERLETVLGRIDTETFYGVVLRYDLRLSILQKLERGGWGGLESYFLRDWPNSPFSIALKERLADESKRAARAAKNNRYSRQRRLAV